MKIPCGILNDMIESGFKDGILLLLLLARFERGNLSMAWFNVGSLILGLIAWILPIVNLAKYNKAKHKNWIALLFASMSACYLCQRCLS